MLEVVRDRERVDETIRNNMNWIKVIDGISRLDYNQYTVNQSVPVQPSVKISEVNTKQYQKPKKVAVNEADKYNLNQDVTAQDYDIYENQVEWKASNCSFRNELDANRESLLCRFSVCHVPDVRPGSA